MFLAWLITRFLLPSSQIRTLLNKAPLRSTLTPDSAVQSLLSLRRIYISASPGDLVAVVGPVGSGKSTLLNGILGECRAITGDVSLAGRVAYVSQKAFIMNATLRDNVTFSKPFDQAKYDAAIYACALGPDIDVLPGGDMCEIGEKGINLSGGQKARVALARAVYHEADVYLLDDPLSAVDAHVGKHLFNKCIVDRLLRGGDKTVILVTNALQFLNHQEVNKIVVLEGGAIKEEGTYDELMSKEGGSFSTLLNTYREKSSESMGSSSRNSSKVDLTAEVSAKKPGSPKKSASASEGTTKGKLMTSELKERETGEVTRAVYLLWARSLGGYHVATLILSAFFGTEVLNIIARWWLSYWSEHGEDETSHQGKFLGVYTAINLTIVLSMFVRQLFLYLKSLHAAKVLYNGLLKTMLRAPMSFFDTTPLGRILNR